MLPRMPLVGDVVRYSTGNGEHFAKLMDHPAEVTAVHSATSVDLIVHFIGEKSSRRTLSRLLGSPGASASGWFWPVITTAEVVV